MNDSDIHLRIAYTDPDCGVTAASVTAFEQLSEPPDQRHEATMAQSINRGRVALDPSALRTLRHGRMLSQQDLADDCWRRNIRVSIATIKRAECGQAVRFRIVRELARCFEVPVERLLRAE